ncbi:MAG: DUF4163 domain-containing protein [Ignavibacteriales bacterium]|jgi:hypothetical protein|nr:DUF4163 domain-containing protein [Ignavibacteriales bacterium]
MKLKISIILAIFTLSLSAQSLQYKMETFEKAYSGKNNQKDTIFQMQISYPVFYGDTSVGQVAKKINSTIQTAIFGEATGGSDELYNGFLQIVQEDEDSSYFTGYWTYSTNVSHEFSKESLISIFLFHDEYLGGAHPNSYCVGLNFDIRTGEPVGQSEIFIAGSEEELNRLGEQIVRQEREIPENQTLSDYGYWFENDKFQLNGNFIVKADGLYYTFVPYEVGPYVLGYTDVYFPFEKIKHLISPNGILGWVVKK